MTYKAAPLLQFCFVRASVSHVAFVLALFVHHLPIFSCLGMLRFVTVVFPEYLYLYFL